MLDTTKTAIIWLLAGALVILAGAFGIENYRARLAKVGQQVAEARVAGLTEDIKRQKNQAASDLRTANASVLAQQKRLDAFHAQQEKTDASNSSTVAERRNDLVRYRADTRLRDQTRTADRRGSSGSAQQAPAIASPDSGAANPTGTPWIFPRAAARASAVDQGDADALRADEINIAYASCRADAFAIRQVSGAVTLLDGELFEAAQKPQ